MRAKRIAAERYEFFWWSNILISLALGAVMFCILNSQPFLSAVVRFLYGRGNGALISETLFSVISLYGRDFIWAYAIVFAIACCFRGSLSGLKTSFLIVLVFEVILGMLSLFSVIPGSFDIGSAAAVFIGNVLAAVIILIHERAFV